MYQKALRMSDIPLQHIKNTSYSTTGLLVKFYSILLVALCSINFFFKINLVYGGGGGGWTGEDQEIVLRSTKSKQSISLFK